MAVTFNILQLHMWKKTAPHAINMILENTNCEAYCLIASKFVLNCEVLCIIVSRFVFMSDSTNFQPKLYSLFVFINDLYVVIFIPCMSFH